MPEQAMQMLHHIRTFYPFPDDCEACLEGLEGPHREPCSNHAHLAEPDGERGHKEEGL